MFREVSGIFFLIGRLELEDSCSKSPYKSLYFCLLGEIRFTFSISHQTISCILEVLTSPFFYLISLIIYLIIN